MSKVTNTVTENNLRRVLERLREAVAPKASKALGEHLVEYQRRALQGGVNPKTLAPLFPPGPPIPTPKRLVLVAGPGGGFQATTLAKKNGTWHQVPDEAWGGDRGPLWLEGGPPR